MNVNIANRRGSATLRKFAAVASLTILAGLFPAVFMMTGARPVTAGGPLFWRIDNFAELDKGELRGVTLDGRGAVTLGPTLTEIFDTKQAHVWSSVADQAGNIYLGAGNEGRIYRVDAAGKGSLFHQTPEVSVMALAVDGQGTLYAGTAPDGKVYRITPQGEARVFFEPKTKYVWALAFDTQGRLLVATGDKGTLYRVAADGTATTLATVREANLTSLRVDPAGNILVGTDPGGMVLRISPEGRVFTLFDSEQREIRDLAIGDDGSIYALALAESAGSGATNAAPPPPATGGALISSSGGGEGSVTVTLSDVQVVDGGGGATGTTAGGSGGTGQAKSVLYRLDGQGAWQSLWESRDAVAFTLNRLKDGTLLVGTNLKGRLYAIDPARQTEPAGMVRLLASLPEGQATRFINSGGRLLITSSNLGKLYELGVTRPVATGVVTGQVLDSVHHATWGRLAFTGTGRIEFETRSGNTATPDATWSEWLKAGEKIASPPARYLQWRATLRPAAAVMPQLRDLTIAYLPRNLAPRLASLNLLPVGVALQPAPPPPLEGVPAALQSEALQVTSAMAMPPRRVFQQGALSLQWQAEDRNGDQLEYAVFYRLDSGTELYPLRSGLRENFLTIDSNELSDGRYIFRVVASDRPANPASQAQRGERETEPVNIDNTAPLIEIANPEWTGATATLAVTVQDAGTIVRRVEYQLDGGDWQPVFPVDGLADSSREEFTLRIELPDRRPRLVAVRAFDANANIGLARKLVVKP